MIQIYLVNYTFVVQERTDKTQNIGWKNNPAPNQPSEFLHQTLISEKPTPPKNKQTQRVNPDNIQVPTQASHIHLSPWIPHPGASAPQKQKMQVYKEFLETPKGVLNP